MSRKVTREQWLNSALRGLDKAFPTLKARGVKASCGWPTRGALARKSGGRTLGQCFHAEHSASNTPEIFISPSMAESDEVLATLAHELIHATQGAGHGHRAGFKQIALGIGLEGKMTATSAGPLFKQKTAALLTKLGDYPHAIVDLAAAHKKQTTRLVKVECGECGYIARTTRTWIDAAGPPLCPCNSEAMEVA